MQFKKYIFVCLSFFMISAQTAEVFTGANQRGRTTFKLQGSIEKGDAQKFSRLVIDNPNIYSFELDSTGGNLNEAIQIAKIVSALYLTTSVKPYGVCASACFFIWLDGHKRLGSPLAEFGGKIGLHRT